MADQRDYSFTIASRQFNAHEHLLMSVIDVALTGSPIESAVSVLTSALLKGLMHISRDEGDEAFDALCVGLVAALKEGRLVSQAAGATKQ